MITTPNFMHVLPTAVRLTQQGPPSIEAVAPNQDGTLTITGTNWMAGSVIYFDGLHRGDVAQFEHNPAGIAAKPPVSSAVVTPPPGKSAQTAILTVFNPDGQNSQFLQAANPATLYLFQSTDAGDYRHQPCLIAGGCGSHG